MANDEVLSAIEALVRKTSRFGLKQLLSISNVSIEEGTLVLDEASISHLPQKFEEANFRYTNCTGDERTRTISESVVTTRSVTTELTTTNTISIESKVGFNLGSSSSFGQFNGDIINKSGSTTTESNGQTSTDQITKTISEIIKIKPWTRLTVKARIIKGLVKGTVSGDVVVDARALVWFGDEYSFGGASANKPIWVKLSDDYFFNVSDRRIVLDGEITSESYQDMEIVYLEKIVSAGDPLCADCQSAKANLLGFSDVVTVIASQRPDVRLLVRPTRATVHGRMDTCSSTVGSRFSSNGQIDFNITCTDCDDTNPSGRFEYDATIDQGNGATQTLTRRVDWGPIIGGLTGSASDNISLSLGETLVAVSVHSEECNCGAG